MLAQLDAIGYPAPNQGNRLTMSLSTQPCDFSVAEPAISVSEAPTITFCVGKRSDALVGRQGDGGRAGAGGALLRQLSPAGTAYDRGDTAGRNSGSRSGCRRGIEGADRRPMQADE